MIRDLRLVTGVISTASILFAVACSEGPLPEASAGGSASSEGIGATGTGCAANPRQEGCDCATPGNYDECGSTHQVVADGILCSTGHVLCLPTGKYGACSSDRIVKTTSLHTTALGTPTSCADPCTAGCTTTTDLPAGIDAGSGLLTDAGLTIVPTAPPANSCTGLSISPTGTSADIVVTSTTSTVSKVFTGTLTPANCNPAAPDPLFYTDKFDVAQFSDTVAGRLDVVVPVAGPVVVGAKLGNFTATTSSNITVAVKESGTANPPPSGASFTNFPTEAAGDATDSNLEIVYPYNGTVLPLGLLAPLLQWRNGAQAANGGVVVTLRYPATGTAIFEVSQLVSESMTSPVPLRSAQPRHQFPQAVWQAFEQTVNRNRATYGSQGLVSVRRRVGSTTYKSKSVTLTIAPGQLKGRVYYQSYGTALVNNYSGAQQSTGGAFTNGNFGAATLVIPPGATAPTVAAGFNGSGGCYVCHSASPNGATLISARDSGYVATRWTFPGTAANAGVAYNSGAALVFAGINPTSTRIMSSAGGFSGDGVSRLFDVNGSVVAGNNIPTAMQGAYPSFSSDGTQVAFTFRGGSASPLSSSVGDGKSVAMMTFDGAKTFSNFRILATPSAPSVWPSFLPAGQNGVVYEVETRASLNGGYSFTRHDCECSTYSGATGGLWWASTGSSPTPTRLNRANGYDASGNNALPVMPTTGHAGYGGTMGPAGAGFYEQNYNYEPTVLPQTIGGYSWVIFTSRRAYGNVATINPYASDPRFDNISIDPTPKKLWVAAISSSPAAGTDPSFPAFYLPGQELIAGNSRAVFSLEDCHPAAASGAALTTSNLCDSDLDCCGGGTTSSCVLDPPPLLTPAVKHCVATTANACRPVGSSCLKTSDCCNAASGGVCANGVCADPPPYYVEQTFQRVYTSSCAPGFKTRWGLFEWQSKTPSDSRIEFTAQQSTDGTTWTPVSPFAIGTASGADITSPSWATTGSKVSVKFAEPTGTDAKKYLRISMRFVPNTDKSKAPTLIDWRQSIECVDNE